MAVRLATKNGACSNFVQVATARQFLHNVSIIFVDELNKIDSQLLTIILVIFTLK